jgi:hypothetical protein
MRSLSTRTVSVSTTPVNIRKAPAFPTDPAALYVTASTLRYPTGGGGIQLYPSSAFTGTLTIGTVIDGETYVLNGVTITFGAAPTSLQVRVGATPTATATNLVNWLKANSHPLFQQASYSSSGAVVTITYASGSSPSTYTLGTNSANITRSGATLAAGTTYGGGLTVDAGADFQDLSQELERWALASTGTISLAVTDWQA